MYKFWWKESLRWPARKTLMCPWQRESHNLYVPSSIDQTRKKQLLCTPRDSQISHDATGAASGIPHSLLMGRLPELWWWRKRMDIQTYTVEAWMLCYAVHFIMLHFGHNLFLFFATDTLHHLGHWLTNSAFTPETWNAQWVLFLSTL